MSREKIYRKLPNKPEKHGWAFYYSIKRSSANVSVLEKHKDGSITIKVVE